MFEVRACAICGVEFFFEQNQARKSKARGLGCSRECAFKGQVLLRKGGEMPAPKVIRIVQRMEPKRRGGA